MLQRYGLLNVFILHDMSSIVSTSACHLPSFLPQVLHHALSLQPEDPLLWLSLAQVKSGVDAVAAATRGAELLAASACGLAPNLHAAHTVAAHCAIAEVYLTDLWYVCAQVSLGSAAQSSQPWHPLSSQ